MRSFLTYKICSCLVAITLASNEPNDKSSCPSNFENEISSSREPAASSSANPNDIIWEEVFVHPNAMQTSSVGISLAQDLSVLMLHEFATTEEIETLKQSAVSMYKEKSHTLGRTDTSTYMRENNGESYLNLTSCWRYSVANHLSQQAKQVSNTLVERLTRFLDTTPEMSTFVEQQFPKFVNNNPRSMLTTHFHNSDLQWYSENDYFGNSHIEPCVNLYIGQKDEFEVHHDGGSVTILLALSDYPSDYQGGGTELFGPDKLRAEKTFDRSGSDHSVIQNSDESRRIVTTKDGTVLVRPKAGTAMIWGTNMFHRALPIISSNASSMRAVWVGSFQLKTNSGKYVTNL